MDRDDIIRFVEDNDVKFIRMQFTDITGAMKNIALNDSQLEEAFGGVVFDGFSVDGFGRMGESDMLLVPDCDTLCIIPWRPQQGKVARFISDVYLGGKPFEGDPRHILKETAAKAAKLGYTLNVQPECEFFLFHTDDDGQPTTKTHDTAGYFDLAPIDLGENARREMCLSLENMGFVVISSHHEAAGGQHEIDFKYDDALRTADNIETFKMVVKIIAQKHGLHATFMPKPLMDSAGNGMHLNLSLLKKGKDVFADPSDSRGLSKEAYWFIGGILKHIRAMSAVLDPLVNSYKRLAPGNEAPSWITWSRRGRSPLVRIPSPMGGAQYIELLSPDPTCNPYLALSLVLSAGLEGIKEKTEPPEEYTGGLLTPQEAEKLGIETLPEDLGEALECCEKDPFIGRVLGQYAFSSYIKVKRSEWESYSREVHKWELDRYLSAY